MGDERDFPHTLLSLKVSRLLLQERSRNHWNYDIAKRSGASSASRTFAILQRFKAKGWVTEQKERPAPIDGRVPRVLYLLTDSGASAMRDVLAQLQLMST